MKKKTVVITYGTFDLFHQGHINILTRAKALGDYLIVGVTSDNFDKTRGKINVQQDVVTRIENVRKTGLADQIIVEEYEGQKIDDIRKYNVDILTVGSDWVGKFDYLNEFCKVVYLPRTEGVSSSQIRESLNDLRIGIVGSNSNIAKKFIKESTYVNGVIISGIFCKRKNESNIFDKYYDTYDELLENSDAVYVLTTPSAHYEYVKKALENNKHVLCESPIAQSQEQYLELIKLAKAKKLILMDSLKTAYSIAYNRMLATVKSGAIGDIKAIDATCTSIKDYQNHDKDDLKYVWSSMYEWGPTALLPIFQLLGTNYKNLIIASDIYDEALNYDTFTQMHFIYDNVVATAKVGVGVKSEGELIISGTKGYLYVPAPWWKTEYYETRFENSNDNKKFYFKIDGEGIRLEISQFLHAVMAKNDNESISREVSEGIVKVIEEFEKKNYIKLN